MKGEWAMAKLSAYGRSELARVELERNEDPHRDDSPEYPASAGKATCWCRTTRTLMSDGTLLEKSDARWPDGQKHSWGWTRRGKAKAGLTSSEWCAQYEHKGWKVIYNGQRPPE